MTPLYFSHYANALQDEKLMAVMCDHGLAGYGCFFALLELMFNNDGYLRANYKFIAFQLHTETELVRAIVEDYGLFEIETATLPDDNPTDPSNQPNGITAQDPPLFYSKKFLEDMQKRGKDMQGLSKKRSDAANARWKNAKDMQVHMQVHMQNGVLQCKEEKRKEDNITPPIAPPKAGAEEVKELGILNEDLGIEQRANKENAPVAQEIYDAYREVYQAQHNTHKKPKDSPELKTIIFQAAAWIRQFGILTNQNSKLQTQNWLLLTGIPGTGKTTLAQAVMRVLSKHLQFNLTDARRVYATDVCNAYNKRDITEAYNEYLNCRLLCIDEIGTEPLTGNYKRGQPVAEMLLRRYDFNLPVILVSNLPADKLIARYPDNVQDRLQERLLTLDFQFASYRKK